MIYLIKLIIFIIFSNYAFANNSKYNNLFKINDQIFTNIDLEKRVNYVSILNNIKIQNLNEEEEENILNDFISVLIFNEYKNINNVNFNNLIEEVEDIYKNNLEKISNNNKLNEDEILNLKNNIYLDTVRKKIIEDLLNSKKKILLKETDELDLIYNYNLNYIIINKNDIDLKLVLEIKNRNDFNNFKQTITQENKNFIFKNIDINNRSQISEKLQKLINNNKKIETYLENEFINIYSIDKTLESYEGIFVKLMNIKINEKLSTDNENCEYISKIQDKVIFKEYEYSKLNTQIKNNLKSINDYIVYNNNNVYNYIFLCDMSYDQKILNQINFNKKVNELANTLQSKFLKKYKKEFNFENLQ